jgi:hypothetical protein
VPLRLSGLVAIGQLPYCSLSDKGQPAADTKELETILEQMVEGNDIFRHLVDQQRRGKSGQRGPEKKAWHVSVDGPETDQNKQQQQAIAGDRSLLRQAEKTREQALMGRLKES